MSQKNPHSNRNIGIAVLVIIVIVLVIVGGVYLSGQGKNNILNPSPKTPFNFGLSISSSSGTVLQGSSIETSVTVTYYSGDSMSVAMSGDSGSSGIQCSFSPSASSPSFTSVLTMTVPDSTPTKAYSVIVTATGGGVTRTVSYTITVLSVRVLVSGTVTTTGFGTHPTQVQFVDTQTGLTYTASMSGNSYSITLQNQHTYSVVVYWQGLLGSSGTFKRIMVVNVGVGSTTMSQNFSG